MERRIIFMLFLALILMFFANLILINKLQRMENGSVWITYADTIEGFKVSDMFKNGITFIVPSKICESCVILTVDYLFKNYRDSLKKFGVSIYLILEKENLVLTRFIQERGLHDFLRVEVNPSCVKNAKNNLEHGLCVFVNNSRIIYASPITNYKALKLFYVKVINYLSEYVYF
jgi:uncharacterized protein YkvS